MCGNDDVHRKIYHHEANDFEGNIHSCFVEKYKTRAPQWEYDFNTFSAYNSQYIMIFWILQQCWGMLVVLSGHPVYISDGYWWF